MGFSELMLLAFLGYLLFGPRKMPQMARTVGRAMAEVKRATSGIQETIEHEVMVAGINDAINEAKAAVITPPRRPALPPANPPSEASDV